MTMRAGSYGNGQVKTFEMRGRRISMTKLLNDLHLALETSVKTERTVGGLALKILNNKAMWHMAGWIEGRYHEL